SKLWAPHTIPRGSGSPTSTCTQRIVLPLLWGSSTNDSTRPTTTGPVTPKPCRSSSSKPTLTSAAWRCSSVTSSGRSTQSRSQLIGTLTSDHHPELLREAHIALDHVAHVVHVVAELQGALDAHAEC